MDNYMIWTALVVTAFLLLKAKASFSRWKAAHNVVLAKYTYEQMEPWVQSNIRLRVNEICERTGWPIERLDQNEAYKYGCYALAMAELGIPPLALNEAWNFVKNPYAAMALP